MEMESVKIEEPVERFDCEEGREDSNWSEA